MVDRVRGWAGGGRGGHRLWSIGGLIVLVVFGSVLLSACNPKGFPDQLGGPFPNSVVTEALSSTGQYVLTGTQNDSLDTANGASLTLSNRDVSNSGTLDTSGNTSTTVEFGSGGRTTGITNIDNASLFVPALSSDGSSVAFEAFDPTVSDSGGTGDCVYQIAFAQIATGTPTLISCQPSEASAGGNEAPPGYMGPSLSANGQYIAFNEYEVRYDQAHNQVGVAEAVFLYNTATGPPAKEVSVTDQGAIPVSTPAPVSKSDIGFSGESTVSADGRFVVFESDWPLTAAMQGFSTDDIGPLEVYVFDRLSGDTREITLDMPDPDGFQTEGPSISHDGRFVSLVASRQYEDTTGRVPPGQYVPVYVVDRDVSSAVDPSGNLTMDTSGNTAVQLVSNGEYAPWQTRIDASSKTDASGHEFADRVAWSEYSPTQSSAPAVQVHGLSATAPDVTGPGAKPVTGKGFTVEPAPGFALKTASAGHLPGSANAGSTTTGGGGSKSSSTAATAASTTSSGSGVVMSGRFNSTGGLSTAQSLPAFGGALFRIQVADLGAQKVETSIASGPGVNGDPRGQIVNSGWQLSADGSSLAYGAVDSSNEGYPFAQVVVEPWLSNLYDTFGFQSDGVYASDPVNVASGSFTNEVTDLPSPSGVYGLDWTRTYNSASPFQSELGNGWTAGDSSFVSATSSGAVVYFDNGRQVTYPLVSGVYQTPQDETAALTHNTDGTWSLTFPDGELWSYASFGALTKRTAADGQSVTLTYAADGQVSTVNATNAGGAADGSLTFTYASPTSPTDLVSVASSDGQSVSYTYGSTVFDLTGVTDVNAKSWTYAYDGLNRLTSLTDPTGVAVVQNSYDYGNRVLSQTAASGAVTNFSYDDSNGTNTVTDNSTGKVLTYKVDSFGRMISVQDPDSKTLTRGYDSRGNPNTEKDRAGLMTTATYDTNGNVLSVHDPSKTNASDPSAGNTTYTYTTRSRVQTETDPDGVVTTYAYTGNRPRPDTVTVTPTSGTPAVTHYTYDTLNRVLTMTDPDGVVTTYSSYNAAGEPGSVQHGSLTATIFTYYPSGLVHARIDPVGNETDYTYNAAGQVLTTTGPYVSGNTNPPVVTNTYDNAGRLLTEVGPGLKNDAPATIPTVTYTYDPTTGLVTNTKQPNGESITDAYNADGDLKTETTPAGTTTDLYDELDRLSQQTDPAGLVTKYTFDADGRPATTVDPQGSTTVVTYNALGQLATSSVQPTSTSDSSPARTSTNTYDADGRPATSTDPTGAVTTYQYDSFGRQYQTIDPRHGTNTTTYTAAGRIKTVTNAAGQVTTNTYDGNGNLSQVTGPALPSDSTPPVTHYTYYADGHVHTHTDPAGLVTTYTYDPSGHVATEVDPDGVKVQTAYDTRGNVLTVTRYTTGGTAFSHTSSTYDLENHLLTATDANGHVTTYSYDAAGNRRTEIDPLSQGSSPQHYAEQWTYDADGNLKTTTDGLGRTTTVNRSSTTGLVTSEVQPSGRTATFSDDFAGETSGVSYTGPSSSSPNATYTYDADGRVLTAANPSGPASYTYDGAGDLTSASEPGGRVTSLSYDQAGRRVGLTYPDGQSISYGYDASGSLVKTVTPNQVMADSFTGATGSTPDAAKWGSAGATIQANQAQMAVTSSAKTAGLISLAPASADIDISMRYQFADNTNGQELNASTRTSFSGTGGYSLRIDSNTTTAHLSKITSGGSVDLATFTVPEDTAGHSLRFRVQGSTIEAKEWNDGASEPSAWSATATDSTTTGAGLTGVSDTQTGTGSTSVNIDNYVQTNPTTAPAATATYTYDADQRPTNVTLPGGSRTYGYNATTGLMTSYSQSLSGANYTDTIGYDTVARPQTLTVNGTAATYGYDLADELTSVATGSNTTGYTYDADGERKTTTAGGTTVTYTYDQAGELTSGTDGSSYTYDADGRQLTATTSASHATYAYDNAGRLGQVANTTGSTTDTQTRTYDAAGQLNSISDTTGSTTSSAALDWDPTSGNTKLISEATAGGTTDLEGLNSWDTATKGGVATAIPVDVYGSAVSTGTGSTLACASGYDAYGNPTGTTSTAEACLGYRGELTTGGGLVDLDVRNYNPAIGALTTVDPVDGAPGGPTATDHYTYANNNPIQNVDPNGEQAVNDAVFTSAMTPVVDIDGVKLYGDSNADCVDSLTACSGPEFAAQGLAVMRLRQITYYSGVHWEVQTGRNPNGFPAARSNHFGEMERADLVAGYNEGADVWEVKAWSKRHSKKKGEDAWTQPYSYAADLDERAFEQGVDLNFFDAYPGYSLQDWAIEYKLGSKDYIAWGDPNPENPGVVFYDDADKVEKGKGSGAGSDDVRPSLDYLQSWDGLYFYGTIKKKSSGGSWGIGFWPGVPVPVPVPPDFPIPIFA